MTEMFGNFLIKVYIKPNFCNSLQQNVVIPTHNGQLQISLEKPCCIWVASNGKWSEFVHKGHGSSKHSKTNIPVLISEILSFTIYHYQVQDGAFNYKFIPGSYEYSTVKWSEKNLGFWGVQDHTQCLKKEIWVLRPKSQTQANTFLETLNNNILVRPGTLHELAKTFNKRKIQILAVQETRLTG